MKDLVEASNKIYRDRSYRLLSISKSLNIVEMLKEFNMENSKGGLIYFR